MILNLARKQIRKFKAAGQTIRALISKNYIQEVFNGSKTGTAAKTRVLFGGDTVLIQLFNFLKDICTDGTSLVQGIERTDLKRAAHILKLNGYNEASFKSEIKVIDWNDYPSFPIRVKQRLKLKLL